jgi:hypothetical protein
VGQQMETKLFSKNQEGTLRNIRVEQGITGIKAAVMTIIHKLINCKHRGNLIWQMPLL